MTAHDDIAAGLIVFAKQPVAGQVKTRLAKRIGAQAAAAVHEAMLECVVRRWSGYGTTRLTLAVSPDAWLDQARRRWPGVAEVVPQGAGDLGERIVRVVAAQWRRWGRPLVLLGADSPDLPAAHMQHALREVAGGRAAMVPTPDGGYCLLAIPRPLPALFEGVDWGSPHVASQTRDAARRCGLELVELPPAPDIDTADDLRALRQRLVGACDPALRQLARKLSDILPPD